MYDSPGVDKFFARDGDSLDQLSCSRDGLDLFQADPVENLIRYCTRPF
jgi:hypothetical protein